MPNQSELYHISQQENFARLDREDAERSRLPCDWCGSHDGMDCYADDTGFDLQPATPDDEMYRLPGDDRMFEHCEVCNSGVPVIPKQYIRMTFEEVVKWVSEHPAIYLAE